jgi:hypothetical protein
MRTKASRTDRSVAMIRVVAMLMAIHSELEPRAVQMLRRLDAFNSLGVSESEFLHVVDECRCGPYRAFNQHSWLTLDDAQVIRETLQKVCGTRDQLVLCRLAGCIITAGGSVHEMGRQIYDRMLLQWGYTRSTVAQAILAQGVHRTPTRQAEALEA